MKRWIGFYCLLGVALLLASCQSGEEATATAAATQEITAVTDTPQPTATAVPVTDTPEATATLIPPTKTPPTPPTVAVTTVAKPAATPTPDKSVPAAQPLAEGQEIDAMQLVLDSERRALNLETSQLTQNVLVTTTGFEQRMTQNCATELPDHAYCRSDIVVTAGGNEPLESYNETVQDGEQIWLRQEGGEWRDVTAEFAESQIFSQEGLQQLTFSEFIDEAEVVGETTIDGVPVYEVAFSLDVNAYVASILGEELAALFTAGADENSGSGRTWIGQADRLVRKALIEMSFVIQGETMSITTQAASFGFNEPVEIPEPTAE